MPRLLAPLLALALLAACQLSLPGGDRTPDATANPVTGGTITTTPLDAPASATAAATPATSATPTAQPASPGDPRPQSRPATAPTTAATDPATAETATPAPADPAATPEIPAELKSPSQIACEEDGGTWARAGEGGGMACVYQTRDGGKRCDGKDDCEGECLARSRTCSPIQPLFGCNAVLLDTGAEVTLCLD